MKSGIYEIVSRCGRRYVGQSQHVERRLREHRQRLEQGRHENSRLQHAWGAHGPDNFSFSVLAFMPIEWLNDAEQLLLDTTPELYNLATCAEAPARGIKRTEEQRRRRMGRTLSAETRHRQRIADSKRGKKRPPHVGLAVGAAARDRVYTPEQREARRQRQLGRKHTPETRAKIAEANRRRARR